MIARFSYADETIILGFRCTVSESAAAVQRKLDSLTNWAEENVVSFDASKSEVIHYLGRKREKPVEITVKDNMILSAKQIPRLRVYLDPHLSF